MVKKIALMTSGGDAPGMNPFVRSTVRYALSKGIVPYGIMNGYSGLISGDLKQMTYDSVCNIGKYGGTILKTSRSKEFRTREGREQAAKHLNDLGIDALICCGGNGSYAGLYDFANPETGEWQKQVIGVPGTIDNDVKYTDYTIGFDTAINTAVTAIDNLRDTGDSHHMHFIVEVMGRHSGELANQVGIATGATHIAIPETITNVDEIYGTLRTKGHDIIVIAEGDETGGAIKLAERLEACQTEECRIDFRICILGHIQRGGTPSAKDRITAHNMSIYALDALLENKTLVSVAEVNSKLTLAGLI
jgi:6-phosphofructokinase 1